MGSSQTHRQAENQTPKAGRKQGNWGSSPDHGQGRCGCPWGPRVHVTTGTIHPHHLYSCHTLIHPQVTALLPMAQKCRGISITTVHQGLLRKKVVIADVPIQSLAWPPWLQRGSWCLGNTIYPVPPPSPVLGTGWAQPPGGLQVFNGGRSEPRKGPPQHHLRWG